MRTLPGRGVRPRRSDYDDARKRSWDGGGDGGAGDFKTYQDRVGGPPRGVRTEPGKSLVTRGCALRVHRNWQFRIIITDVINFPPSARAAAAAAAAAATFPTLFSRVAAALPVLSLLLQLGLGRSWFRVFFFQVIQLYIFWYAYVLQRL